MKHIWKKTAAFAAAALMTAALAIPAMSAFAADPVPPDLGAGSPTTKLNKTIMVYNDEGATVYVPSITYTYSVDPVTVSDSTPTQIKDASDNTTIVKSGVTGGITMGSDATAVFPTAEDKTTVEATSTGVAVTDTFELAYDATKFTKAGVYRYKLTETASPAPTTVGISRAEGYNDTRYIDVYVQMVEGTPTIVGTVVFFEDGNIDKTTNKTDGFTEQVGTTQDGKFETDPTTSVADKYFTYNYVVKKVVENSYTGTEKFDFQIDVTGTDGQKFFKSAVNGAVADATTSVAVGEAVAAQLGNDDTITLAGLPANVKVAVKETNGNPATYNVSVADTSGTALSLDKTSIQTSESAGFAAQAISAYAGTESTKPAANLVETTFTNKLVDISVTGVLFMVAPFVLMIAAGVFFITVIARSRKRESAENVI